MKGNPQNIEVVDEYVKAHVTEVTKQKALSVKHCGRYDFNG